jgi:hypothetical protein
MVGKRTNYEDVYGMSSHLLVPRDPSRQINQTLPLQAGIGPNPSVVVLFIQESLSKTEQVVMLMQKLERTDGMEDDDGVRCVAFVASLKLKFVVKTILCKQPSQYLNIYDGCQLKVET